MLFGRFDGAAAVEVVDFVELSPLLEDAVDFGEFPRVRWGLQHWGGVLLG